GILIYYLAREINVNKQYALLAGILYVVSGVAAANGRFAHNDLYLQLFTILCVFAVVKYQFSNKLIWLYVSFLMVGFAASSKYTGGSLILLPIFVFLFSNWKQISARWLYFFSRLLFGGLIAYVGYGIGTPKAL